jgi:hypothetical protein
VPATGPDDVVTMQLWEVRTKVGVDPDWPGCEVVAETTRSVGNDCLLVAADDLSIAVVRDRPGVVSAEPARDGSYVDSRTGATIEVQGGGTRWRLF